MRVFLTGSTGLLGINTVHALLERGHTILALARDRQKAERVLPSAAIASGSITIIVGDIEQSDEWTGHLGDADALIHTAAYFREYFGAGDHHAKLESLNVTLPVQLAQEASRAGMKRIVMVSSSGVVQARGDGMPATEDDPARGSVPASGYFMSKVRMEDALSEVAPTLQSSLVVVRPGWMFGPNDYAPTAAGRLVTDLLRRRMVQIVSGTPVSIADARDVADGIARILDIPRSASVYQLAGNPITPRDALGEVARHAGGRVQVVPFPLALGLSALIEPVSRLRGVPNPLPRVGLLTLHDGVKVSSERAKTDLSVTFRPFTETARDTVEFFRRIEAEKSG